KKVPGGAVARLNFSWNGFRFESGATRLVQNPAGLLGLLFEDRRHIRHENACKSEIDGCGNQCDPAHCYAVARTEHSHDRGCCERQGEHDEHQQTQTFDHGRTLPAYCRIHKANTSTNAATKTNVTSA